MGGRVLVLNATFEPINVCSVRRAVVLLLKEKAELLERGMWELHSESATLARPVVIRLVSYVHVPRDAHRRKITRRAVFARDDWTCQYCGSRSNLTVDHVIPRSKGGPRAGRTSSPRARRATGARATCSAQAGMHPRHSRARRARRSSSTSRARRSRRPGAVPAGRGLSDRPRQRGPGSGCCNARPVAPVKARGAPSTRRPPLCNCAGQIAPISRRLARRMARSAASRRDKSGDLHDGGPGWIPLGGSSRLLRPNGRPPPESRKYCQPT